jgi:SAM-dependent methyltransferase
MEKCKPMNISKPLVSIITCFLNAEKFFAEAIESVIAQTYDRWELLLVDDGSTDSSTKIALQYAEQYPDQIRYLEHERHQNRGKSTSRNLGIQQAKGDLIAFLDADDIYLSQKLERQIAILEAYPEAGMVYGPTLMWFSWTGKTEDLNRDFLRFEGVPQNALIPPPQLIPPMLQCKAVSPATCSVLIRRPVIEAIGGFDESIQFMYEDQVLFFKICLKTPVFEENSCWDFYRQHPDSSCYVAERQGIYRGEDPSPTHLAFLTWLKTYLTQEGINDPQVRQALNTMLFPYRHPRLHYLSSQFTYGHQALRKYMKNFVKTIAKETLPASTLAKIRARRQGLITRPGVGHVKFGDLRQVTPFSQHFGYDRGTPIDRYYIENFLAEHCTDIHGRVLEIGDNAYTCRFGGDRVTQSEVLHVVEGNPEATIVGDLADNADHIESNAFDCLVLTQTIHLIYDMRKALQTIERILKPGGVALVTVPGISQICPEEWKEYWCWSLTTFSAKKLFEEVFPISNIEIQSCGNVLVTTAFLQGLALEELKKHELDYHDPSYQLTITIRAVKSEVIS